MHHVQHLLADGEQGIERAKGILRHEGDPAAENALAALDRVHADEIAAGEADRAAAQFGRRMGQHAQDGAHEGGFSAAGLAHEAHHLALGNG